MRTILILSLLLLSSCFPARQSIPAVPGVPQLTETLSPESVSNLSILSAVGGICIVGGVIVLLLPGASNLRAFNAILIGIVLILLNIGVREYLPYIYIPFIVGTGILSIAITYRAVRYVLNWRKQKCLSSQTRRLSSEHSGSSSSLESSLSQQESGDDLTS